MGGVMIPLAQSGQLVSPAVPQEDLAVGPDFERFDGLDIPSDHPATNDPISGGVPFGSAYGSNHLGAYPRPGAVDTPVSEQVYTPGPLKGLVGTIQGQPIQAAGVRDDLLRLPPGRGYTPGKTHSIQFRRGVGQHGPSSLGLEQTIQLSEITNNPPEPGDLTSILAGLG